MLDMDLNQGWLQELSDGADSSDRGLKYGFQGTVNAKTSEKNGL